MIPEINAGYAPDPSGFKSSSTPRVFMLDEVHDPDQRKAIDRAVRLYHQPRNEAEQAGIVKTENNWYNSWSGARRDFLNSAQKAADTTGSRQTVHHHAHGVDCEGLDHTEVDPDLIRRPALTRK